MPRVKPFAPSHARSANGANSHPSQRQLALLEFLDSTGETYDRESLSGRGFDARTIAACLRRKLIKQVSAAERSVAITGAGRKALRQLMSAV